MATGTVALPEGYSLEQPTVATLKSTDAAATHELGPNGIAAKSSPTLPPGYSIEGQTTAPPGTPTMSAAPKKGMVGRAIDAISEKEVPGTGVTVGEAGKRAVEFAHIAGSEALTLGTGPEGAAAKIAGMGGEAAQALLRAHPSDLGLAEWVEKMGVSAEEAPAVIKGALQSAEGSAAKFIKHIHDFAEAYPHIEKALKVAKMAGKVAGAAGTAGSIYGAWKVLTE